jgi:ketosteroid isomerase-like protein
MRITVLAMAVWLAAALLTFGFELTEEQKELWNTLEEQVALDMKKDVEGEMKYIHPKACIWGDQSPMPVSPSEKAISYYKKWMDVQDEVVAHNMIPVSVVVVDDVAIINFYLHMLTKDEEGEHKEVIIRGHNTWKKENGRWLLLSTYNTTLRAEEEDD